MYKSMLAGALLLGTVGAGPAMAACLTTDMNGRWDLYAFGTTSSTLRCSLTVAANGVTGSCVNQANQSQPLVGGTLVARTTCRIAGVFNTPPVPGTAIFVQNAVQQATMAPDKGTVAGLLVVIRSNATFPMMFEAVRR